MLWSVLVSANAVEWLQPNALARLLEATAFEDSGKLRHAPSALRFTEPNMGNTKSPSASSPSSSSKRSMTSTALARDVRMNTGDGEAGFVGHLDFELPTNAMS